MRVLATLVFAARLMANPSDPIVVRGEAAVSEIGNAVEIVAGDKAVIDWGSFSIGAGEKTLFFQPGAEAAVLNRVTGSSHSQIDGMLEANGRVYLMNPHGVVIGKEGVIIASDFAATTQEIVDLDKWHEVFDRSSCLHFDAIPGQGVINCGGSIQAVGFKEEGGRILLVGQESQVSGHISAGDVWVLGEEIRIASEGRIDAPGGSVQIGGDYQGKNESIPNARTIAFESGAAIDASAVSEGPGGRVILWSDEKTSARGKILACGSGAGDGGFVEISSKGQLEFKSSVDTRSPFGKAGLLLLDPSDITISTAASAPALTTPVYNPGVAAANILDTDLSFALNSTNVTILTSAGVGGSGDITILDGVDFTVTPWSSVFTLTLLADQDINFLPMGTGIILTNGGTGDVVFSATRDVTIGDLTATASSLIATGGDISIQALADVTILGPSGAAQFLDIYSTSATGSVTINSTGGDILINHADNQARIGVGFDTAGFAPMSGLVGITAPAGGIAFQVGSMSRGIDIGSFDRVEIVARDDVQFLTGANPAVGDQILIQVDSLTGNASRIESAQGSIICNFEQGQNSWTFNNSFLQVTAAVDWLVHDEGPGSHLFPISANAGISANVGRDILFEDIGSGGLFNGISSSRGNIDFTAGRNIR